ncbi:bacteriophage tail sheath protein [Aquitalea magnusonii]|uniref:Bacteriophage tail sheath protein n=1 Tax=Aquitalea magnusonii TaxID=332411 RepID=A0A3G9GBZ3_9NEIS|nr:phage tail sheath C-terminal domain-containing protein [Aquitalea magnusonii]BBF84884.1 bacteriophage tail sheath protein [Aquitalea magnusonii]
MASQHINFDTIPASTRKPGHYYEFNTRLAVRTLPGNPQRVLVIGQRLASGSQPALQAVDVFSDAKAAQLFGQGSQAHLMARAAIVANPYLQLSVIGVDDAPASIAASGKLKLEGSASSAGVFSLWVGNQRIDIGVANGDSAAKVLQSLHAVFYTRIADFPVSASLENGSITLSARNKGSQGNGIRLRSQCTATGLLASHPANLTGGSVDPDLRPALAAVAAAGHQIIASPLAEAEALQQLRQHLEFVSGPMEQRGAIATAGWPGSLATGTALMAQINSGRISMAWHRGSFALPCEIAAGYAAVAASEEDPARPLNTLEIKGLDVPPLADQTMRTEQENALYNGLTPLEVGPGGRVQIVRAVSSYTRDAQGVEDEALLDLTTIRTLDYVRRACRQRTTQRFPRDKLSERTPDKVRSEILDVLYKLEELEILEAVDANKDGVLVERDQQNVGWLCVRIPADVVNGLHVIAGRIDLLL